MAPTAFKLLLSITFFVTAFAGTTEKVDFVIVGAGTAGCALAGRLCEALPDANIVLLERADPRSEEEEFLVRAPRNAARVSVPGIAESYESKPNKGLFGRKTVIATGKTLGGSSSINGMQWTLPIHSTIDEWNIKGLSSCAWKKYVQRAYKAVGFAPPKKRLQQIYTRDYIAAANRQGFLTDKRKFATNSRTAIWVNRLAADQQGRRRDSFTAYVKPVMNTTCKNNLQIIQSATVTRVLLNKAHPPRGYGVEYVKSDGSRSRKMQIRGDTILLTAGPFESPKLLQLSGIGPKDVLRRAGVKLRVNLGVGKKTQGRAVNVILARYTGVPLAPVNNLTLINSQATRRQFERGEGGLLGISASAINGIVNSLGYITGGFGIVRTLGDSEEPLLGTVCLGNPDSFGHLQIQDNNPFSPPAVQLNLLGKPSDESRLRRCVKRVGLIHDGFSPEFGMQQFRPPPGGNTEAYIRNTSSFGLHFVGGCAVDTVVTRNLGVRGVHGLRVVDASVFKKMPVSAGPLASVYTLAEFMAEKLAKSYVKKAS